MNIKHLIKKISGKTFFSARFGMYSLLNQIDHTLLKKENMVFILCYHSISDDSWRFGISPHVFKRQIEYLKSHYTFISLKELSEYIKGTRKITQPSVVLTFDDGYQDILHVKEYLTEHKIKPAVFLLSDTKKANLRELGTKRPFLTKNDIFTLIDAGWEIGCHSATHSNLQKLSSKQIEREVVTAKKTLERDLDVAIDYFAYPRGKYSLAVLQSLKKAKYILGLTMDDGFMTSGINPYTLPRIGIDKTHSLTEFKAAFSPSVVSMRRLVKQTFVGRYL